MATFGDTAIEPFTFNIIANEKRAFKFSMLEAGTITKLTMYLGGGAVANHIKAVIYADSAGAPGAKLKEGNEITIAVSQALGWVDLTLPSSLVVAAPAALWIGYIVESSNGTIRYKDAVGTMAVNGDAYAGGATDPFGTPNSSAFQWSVYATYTPATGTAPANTSLPTISGTAAVGNTLSGSLGGWTGATSFTTVWKKDGAAISGATSSTYEIQSADAGHTLTYEVTAINASGNTVATSAGLSVPGIFTLTAAPTFTGTLAVGSTQTVVPGTYLPAASTLTYQWYRSLDGGATWVVISGATATTYVLTNADAPNSNTFITVDETATA
jgi:hypothetical protein